MHVLATRGDRAGRRADRLPQQRPTPAQPPQRPERQSPLQPHAAEGADDHDLVLAPRDHPRNVRSALLDARLGRGAEHPFYALTGGAGEFELRGLPPGRYTLKVWQERLGTISKDVV